jgi:hypothetical protein
MRVYLVLELELRDHPTQRGEGRLFRGPVEPQLNLGSPVAQGGQSNVGFALVEHWKGANGSYPEAGGCQTGRTASVAIEEKVGPERLAAPREQPQRSLSPRVGSSGPASC